MAMDADTLKAAILTELDSRGWDTSTSPQAGNLAEAIANAVVDHITASAEAVVSSGSSSGNWPIV